MDKDGDLYVDYRYVIVFVMVKNILDYAIIYYTKKKEKRKWKKELSDLLHLVLHVQWLHQIV